MIDSLFLDTSMFNGNSKDYNQISLEDFSDDDSSDGELGGGGYRDRTSKNGGPTSSDPLERQQQLMKQQDQGLEMLGLSAERLGTLSMQINDELNQQNKMLNEMDDELDQANENLDIVTRKTKEFIAASGGQKNCLLILTLSLIALILFFLILYT